MKEKRKECGRRVGIVLPQGVTLCLIPQSFSLFPRGELRADMLSHSEISLRTVLQVVGEREGIVETVDISLYRLQVERYRVSLDWINSG